MRFFTPGAAALVLLAAPLGAQTVPAPSTTTPPITADDVAPPVAATPAPVELTDKEKSTLTRCSRLTTAEQAQSSRCSDVMAKAGKGDPAKARPATPAERR